MNMQVSGSEIDGLNDADDFGHYRKVVGDKFGDFLDKHAIQTSHGKDSSVEFLTKEDGTIVQFDLESSTDEIAAGIAHHFVNQLSVSELGDIPYFDALEGKLTDPQERTEERKRKNLELQVGLFLGEVVKDEEVLVQKRINSAPSAKLVIRSGILKQKFPDSINKQKLTDLQSQTIDAARTVFGNKASEIVQNSETLSAYKNQAPAKVTFLGRVIPFFSAALSLGGGAYSFRATTNAGESIRTNLILELEKIGINPDQVSGKMLSFVEYIAQMTDVESQQFLESTFSQVLPYLGGSAAGIVVILAISKTIKQFQKGNKRKGLIYATLTLLLGSGVLTLDTQGQVYRSINDDRALAISNTITDTMGDAYGGIGTYTTSLEKEDGALNRVTGSYVSSQITKEGGKVGFFAAARSLMLTGAKLTDANGNFIADPGHFSSVETNIDANGQDKTQKFGELFEKFVTALREDLITTFGEDRGLKDVFQSILEIEGDPYGIDAILREIIGKSGNGKTIDGEVLLDAISNYNNGQYGLDELLGFIEGLRSAIISERVKGFETQRDAHEVKQTTGFMGFLSESFLPPASLLDLENFRRNSVEDLDQLGSYLGVLHELRTKVVGAFDSHADRVNNTGVDEVKLLISVLNGGIHPIFNISKVEFTKKSQAEQRAFIQAFNKDQRDALINEGISSIDFEYDTESIDFQKALDALKSLEIAPAESISFSEAVSMIAEKEGEGWLETLIKSGRIPVLFDILFPMGAIWLGSYRRRRRDPRQDLRESNPNHRINTQEAEESLYSQEAVDTAFSKILISLKTFFENDLNIPEISALSDDAIIEAYTQAIESFSGRDSKGLKRFTGSTTNRDSSSQVIVGTLDRLTGVEKHRSEIHTKYLERVHKKLFTQDGLNQEFLKIFLEKMGITSNMSQIIKEKGTSRSNYFEEIQKRLDTASIAREDNMMSSREGQKNIAERFNGVLTGLDKKRDKKWKKYITTVSSPDFVMRPSLDTNIIERIQDWDIECNSIEGKIRTMLPLLNGSDLCKVKSIKILERKIVDLFDSFPGSITSEDLQQVSNKETKI